MVFGTESDRALDHVSLGDSAGEWTWFRVSRFDFRVSGFGFRVSTFGFRVPRFAFRVSRFAFRILGSEGGGGLR